MTFGCDFSPCSTPYFDPSCMESSFEKQGEVDSEISHQESSFAKESQKTAQVGERTLKETVLKERAEPLSSKSSSKESSPKAAKNEKSWAEDRVIQKGESLSSNTRVKEVTQFAAKIQHKQPSPQNCASQTGMRKISLPPARVLTFSAAQRAPSSSMQGKGKELAAPMQLFSREASKKSSEPLIQRKKEQEEQKERREQQKNFFEEEKAEKKKQKVMGISSPAAAYFSHASYSSESSSDSMKPILESPSVESISLGFMLDKVGIRSEHLSALDYKERLEAIQRENEEVHKLRIEELRKSIEKEKESIRWGTAIKVFSWMASFVSLLGGIIMVATGIGAIAGSLLIVGGVISLGNQLMEETGGWKKVIELLPGDDFEKKQAVVTWIQIGIAVLSLILSGAGVLIGGFSVFGEASTIANLLIGGVAAIGMGITTIGKGVEDYLYYNCLSEAKKYEKRKEELRMAREDLMDSVEETPERLTDYYDSMARLLGFLEEINRSYQRAWKTT